jgi:two-component system, OmpR family, alkaline phosphatase synthesis response regulator PhoP
MLIAEDDAEMSPTLREGFGLDQYSVILRADGLRTLRLATAANFDAIVFDMMMPDLDGFAVPIVTLTVWDSISDIVFGLDVGSAAAVTKPFSFRELSARVRSFIRRSATTYTPPTDPIFRVAVLRFDRLPMEV